MRIQQITHNVKAPVLCSYKTQKTILDAAPIIGCNGMGVFLTARDKNHELLEVMLTPKTIKSIVELYNEGQWED